MSSSSQARQSVNTFVDTALQVALHPKEFFARLPRSGDFASPVLFAVICILIGTVLSGIVQLAGTPRMFGPFGERMGGPSVGGFIASLIFAPIFGIIGLFIFSGFAHLLVLLFVGPNNQGYEATFRVAAYSQVTNLATWVPFIGPLFALYGLYLAIVGIREMHGTTTGRAALVVLFPFIVLFALTWLALLVALAVALGIMAARS